MSKILTNLWNCNKQYDFKYDENLILIDCTEDLKDFIKDNKNQIKNLIKEIEDESIS